MRRVGTSLRLAIVASFVAVAAALAASAPSSLLRRPERAATATGARTTAIDRIDHRIDMVEDVPLSGGGDVTAWMTSNGSRSWIEAAVRSKGGSTARHVLVPGASPWRPVLVGGGTWAAVIWAEPDGGYTGAPSQTHPGKSSAGFGFSRPG